MPSRKQWMIIHDTSEMGMATELFDKGKSREMVCAAELCSNEAIISKE